MLKVTEGGNTFDTPQKDAGDKRLTPKSKNQEVLAQKDRFLESQKKTRKALLPLRGQKGSQTSPRFKAPQKTDLNNIKRIEYE